jgi:hypothetical protein
MADDKRLARIRPGKKGFKVKRYMYKGTLYVATKGWYEVGPGVAEELRKLHQDEMDSDSPLLFDVVTREEALKIEQEETEQAHRAPATRPNRSTTVGGRAMTQRQKESGDLKTSDLPGHQQEDPPMLDPDPDGHELTGPDEQDGIAPIGRVTDHEKGHDEETQPRRRTSGAPTSTKQQHSKR